MKTRFFLLLAAALLFFGKPAQADVSFSFFYSSLSPHGDWLEVADYGYCWRPARVSVDWRPYADGYWAYTDVGWTWVSYEDFGDITYHYGRWVFIEDEGWCWVPDYEWGPAWVSWRYSDDYVGWAPLPPAAQFDYSIGFNVWVDSRYDIGPYYYNFCEVRYFGAPALRSVIIAPQRNVTIINKTVNITNITYKNKVVVNRGPDFAKVSARSERKIERLKLVRKTDDDSAKARLQGKRGAQRKDGELVMVAPQVKKDSKEARPERVAKKIDQPKVDKGWAAVGDETVKQQIRAKQRAEAEGKHREESDLAEQQQDGSNIATREQKQKDRKPDHVKRDNIAGPGTGEREEHKPATADIGGVDSEQKVRKQADTPKKPKAQSAQVPRAAVNPPNTNNAQNAQNEQRARQQAALARQRALLQNQGNAPQPKARVHRNPQAPNYNAPVRRQPQAVQQVPQKQPQAPAQSGEGKKRKKKADGSETPF
jgi:hypothetical protein